MLRFYQVFRSLWASIGLIVLLSACETPQQPITNNTGNPTNPTEAIAYGDIAQLSEPQRSAVAIKQAQRALQNQQTDTAEQLILLAQLNQSNTALHTTAINTASALIKHSNSPHNLNDWFTLNQFMLTNSSASKAASLRFKSRYAGRINTLNDAAAYSLDLSNTPYFNNEDADFLWTYLSGLSLQQIDAFKSLYLDSDPSTGWLSLASAYSNNGNSLQQQANSLDEWLNLWPNHTAKYLWPTELSNLQQAAARRLATAVVVLPLSGRLGSAGKALQTAILAAHTSQPQFETLQFIDSVQYAAPEELISLINSYSPDVIIGPLEKSKALALAQNPRRISPLVSLNTYTSNHDINHDIQLSLNIEDEASFLAKTIDDSMKHVLVVSTNNALAERASNSFKTHWLARQDVKLDEIKLADKQFYSKDIETGFLLTEAKARQTKIENIFIERMESNPRRRQDISHIFLAASPAEARAINPLFAYHFASGIPVYSPSMIFDGQTNHVANRDLNDIIFSDTPWTIANTDPLKRQLLSHMNKGGTRSKNLHALGIDAYFIAARTKLWQDNNTHIFNGRTGTIVIKPGGKTQRLPALAKIERQRVEAVSP